MFPLQVLLKNEPVHPFGLAVYGDYIFWTDWVRRAVLRADKYTGGDMKVLRADIPQQPMGIVAVANDTNNCTYCSVTVIKCWLKVFNREKNNWNNFQEVVVADATSLVDATGTNRLVKVVTCVHMSSGEFSPCRTNNGGCQDLCLPTSDGRVNCSCRGDRQLLEDSTCSCKWESFIMWG